MGTNWLGYELVAPVSSSTSLGSNIMPSSGADPKDWKYLSIQCRVHPSVLRKRVCNPLCLLPDVEAVTNPVTDVVLKDELPPQYQQEAKTLVESSTQSQRPG